MKNNTKSYYHHHQTKPFESTKDLPHQTKILSNYSYTLETRSHGNNKQNLLLIPFEKFHCTVNKQLMRKTSGSFQLTQRNIQHLITLGDRKEYLILEEC